MIRRLSFAALLLAAPPALAQELTAARPADCVPKVTLHYTQCNSMTLLTCMAGPGEYLRIESSTDGQLGSILLQTLDYRRIAEGFGANVMMTGNLELSQPFPVMDLGPDNPSVSHELHIEMNVFGITRPASFTGAARFAGSITLPSGDVVEEAILEINQNLPPPMPPVPGGGSYYLDRTSGYAIEGFISFDFPGEEDREVPTPLDILHPGDSGFDQTTPAGGCDMISSVRPETSKVRA